MPAWFSLDEQDQQHQHDDLAEHRAGHRFEELVDDPQGQRRDQRAPQIADAAEHHDHETVDDVALAEIGADIVDLAQRHACHAGDARAQSERHRIDPGGADAHRRRHAPVLRHRAHLQAERRVAQHRHQGGQHHGREHDDVQPVIGDGQAAEHVGAAHPGRRRHLAVGRPEDRAHHLLENERQPPGREQRFQRAAIEEADQRPLDHHADAPDDQEGQRNGEHQAGAEQSRQIGLQHLLHHEGDV